MERDEKDWFQNQLRWTFINVAEVALQNLLSWWLTVLTVVNSCSLEEAPSGLFSYNAYMTDIRPIPSRGVLSLVRYIGVFLDKWEMSGWLKSKAIKGLDIIANFSTKGRGFTKNYEWIYMLQSERRDGVQYNGQTYLPRELMKTQPQRPRGSLLGNWKSAPFFSPNWLPLEGKGEVSEDDEDSYSWYPDNRFLIRVRRLRIFNFTSWIAWSVQSSSPDCQDTVYTYRHI